MATKIGSPPPPVELSGRDEWAILVSDILAVPAQRIASRLAAMGIESRTIVESPTLTLLVRVSRLGEAMFVLAQVAYERPATLDAPFAETGPVQWIRPLIKFAATLTAVLTAIVLVGSAFEPPDIQRLKCSASGVMAPRGGCLELDHH